MRALGKQLFGTDDLAAIIKRLRTDSSLYFDGKDEIVKKAEYDEFLQVISPWEREHLLLNV